MDQFMCLFFPHLPLVRWASRRAIYKMLKSSGQRWHIFAVISTLLMGTGGVSAKCSNWWVQSFSFRVIVVFSFYKQLCLKTDVNPSISDALVRCVTSDMTSFQPRTGAWKIPIFHLQLTTSRIGNRHIPGWYPICSRPHTHGRQLYSLKRSNYIRKALEHNAIPFALDCFDQTNRKCSSAAEFRHGGIPS